MGYKTVDVKTIDTILGKSFEISERTASHIRGRLSYPADAFHLYGSDKGGFSRVGVSREKVYKLKALKAGTYKIEFQLLQPGPPDELDNAPVGYARVYTVKVRD